MGSFSEYPKQPSIAARWPKETIVRELDCLSAFLLDFVLKLWCL